VAGTLNVGDAAAVAVAGGNVWVADEAGKRLVRVEPKGRVAERLPVESRPTAVTGGSSLWVAAGAAPAGHRGGKLLVESSFCNQFCLDPATGFGQGWESLTPVYDSLLGCRRVPGVAGQALVGALATSVPKPLDGGRTYCSRCVPASASPTGGSSASPTSAPRWSARFH
jgi:hypothetical protein